MLHVVPSLPLPTVAVRGTQARFPVHRIYCVGRNYADHAREMGASIDKGAPVFFQARRCHRAGRWSNPLSARHLRSAP